MPKWHKDYRLPRAGIVVIGLPNHFRKLPLMPQVVDRDF